MRQQPLARDREQRRLPAWSIRARPQTWPITGHPPAGPEPDLVRIMLTTLLVTVAAILAVGVAVAVRYVAGGGSITVAASVLLALLWLAIGIAVAGKRHVREARAPLAVTPSPQPAVAAPDEGWVAARERFDRLREDYAGYECDPVAVLRLPALADVAVASTARFVDAFAEAQAMDSDRFPGSPHADRFIAAVDRAERAWRAAHEAAERIRDRGLAPAERATVERVIKLLSTARESDSEPERLTAYARARAELARLDRVGVLHLPQPAQAAIDLAARGQLPR